MKRPLRNNLVLAGSLGLLGLLAWQLEPTEAPPPLRLSAINPALVQQIRLAAGSEEPLLLQRRGEHWWLTQPVEIPANPTEVQTILAVTHSASLQQYPRAELDLAKLGLDPAYFSLELDEARLDFGATETLNNQRYVLAGQTVHLINEISPSSFDGNYADLVSRKLLAGLGELESISLPGRTIQRNQAGWTSVPASPSADSLQRLVDAWRNSAALWTVLAQNDEVGGDEIRLTGSAGAARYRVLKTKPQFELLRPDLKLIYVLPQSALGELLPNPEE